MRSRSASPVPLRELPFLEAFADFSGASVTRFAMVRVYRPTILPQTKNARRNLPRECTIRKRGSLRSCGEGLQPLLVDLQHDAGIAVGYFAHLVLRSGSEDLRHFGPRQFVIVHEPIRHICRRLAEGIIERATESHGHQRARRFHSSAQEALS